MAKLTGSVIKYPARMSLLAYIVLNAVGGLILVQPACRRPSAPPIEPVDAVFTAVSATCVTGLAVRSTQNDFSFAGQVTILVLVQVGGIGIMTITTFALFRLRGRGGLRQRMMVAESLGFDDLADLRSLLARVILLTVSIEALGVLVLWTRHMAQMPIGDALWTAVFHAVSAFCNAGFSLRDNSLVPYQSDPVVSLTIAALIFLGGIGFPVLLDLWRSLGEERGNRWARLTLHTKLMIIGTAGMLVLGLSSFLLLEWNGALAGRPYGTRLLIAIFHTVSARTAGFNSVEIASLSNATLFTTMLLMIIGAGPASTGGGAKVSTMMVLILRAWATFRGYSRVNIFRRTIPRETVERAIATVMLFGVVSIIALTVLLVIEQASMSHLEAEGLFLEGAFEIVSALGTVGLSTGITPELRTPSKILIACVMLIGRLGPISVFIAISGSERKEAIEYPGEEPLIG